MAVAKVLQRRDTPTPAPATPPSWPPMEGTLPVTEADVPAAPPEPLLPPWTEPVDGACPPTHPVKVKLSSKLYHLPGMLVYERTHPDRCYLTPEAAEADGFTRAKR